ncbi:MAG: uracil-DNA glycosylase [Actinobacteria bacterium]|nr:uracil-DNA glycosylase [Actinomycetota bacterium]
MAEGRDPRDALAALTTEVVRCRACPRLVAWREQVGREKRAAYRDWRYWARPVPGFGDPAARLVIVGLAPAAHGANRTGRMFTGDRSGDFLLASLHRTGFASQPRSRHRDDGLALRDCWITAAVRCAPPANRPTADERRRCMPWLHRELAALPARLVVALGGVAWTALCDTLGPVRPRPRFTHKARAAVNGYTMLGSYHPSQQNTFTGRLTPPMLDDVFTAARLLLDA